MTSVLYIGGFGRSGSTLLERLAGTQRGFCAGGELVNYWSHGLLEGRLCACGETFYSCGFWSAVRESDPVLADHTVARMIVDTHNVLLRTRNIHRLWSKPARHSVHARLPAEYRTSIVALYRGVLSVSGVSTVVDSSKHPTYAYLLAASGVHVRVVHLVRDPRGVAYSWTRRRIEPGGGAALEMHRFSPYQSALIWDSWNLSFRFLRNCFEGYMTLKYEELVADPLGAVGSVIAFGATSSIDRAGGVSHNVGPNSHSLSGNPTRFIQTAPVVTLDDEWMKAMARTARVTVTVLTMPLLVQYGYPLRVHLPAT